VAISGGAEVVYLGGSAISTTVISGGYQVVSNGGHASGATASDGGLEIIYAGGSATSATMNSGGIEVVLSGGSAIGTTLSSGGREVVSSGGTASNTVMNVGAAIDVAYLSYTSGGSVNVNTSGLLIVSVGGHSYLQQLSGNYADTHFQLEQDAGSGTRITAEPGAPCYRSGTHILTDRGEAAVEHLRIGDLVQTVLGGALTPIIWVGRRKVDCAHHPHPRKVWPVRIAAGAFGSNRPHTDLFLSPDHAVYVNGVLIPIKHLINGSTITQVPTDHVTYHHLELPAHDVLLAEGLPAESFLDLRDGSNYANRPGPIRLYPDYSARIWEAFGCAKLVVTGSELQAARTLVAGVASARAAA
jgi:autotransporter passenger strand-loop-strand repeat protein